MAPSSRPLLVKSPHKVLLLALFYLSSDAIHGVNSLRFDWSMPPRFGVDRDGDGLVDYIPLEPGAAESPTLRVDFECIEETSSSESGGERFQWKIDGEEVTLLHDDDIDGVDDPSCGGHIIFEEQRSFEVELTVGSKKFSDVVFPRDILIVGIGDSLASGEGAPEIPLATDDAMDAIFQLLPLDLDPGKKFFGESEERGGHQIGWKELAKIEYQNLARGGARWQPERIVGREHCHRSARSYQALAARAIEEMDSKSTVTFVHLACSDDRSVDVIAKQVPDLKEVIGTRPVDAMMLTVGANDVGFRESLLACISQGDCSTEGSHPFATGVYNALTAICSLPTAPDDCKRQVKHNVPSMSAAKIFLEYGLPTLEERFSSMGQALHRQLNKTVLVDASKVVFMGYPSPFCSETGDLCYGSIPGVSNEELEFFYSSELLLEQALRNEAEANEWSYVNVTEVVSHHGLCSEPIGDRYFDSIPEEFLRQGDLYGVFHPNEKGHKAISDKVEEELIKVVFPRDTMRHAEGAQDVLKPTAALAQIARKENRLLLSLLVSLAALLTCSVYRLLKARSRRPYSPAAYEERRHSFSPTSCIIV